MLSPSMHDMSKQQMSASDEDDESDDEFTTPDEVSSDLDSVASSFSSARHIDALGESGRGSWRDEPLMCGELFHLRHNSVSDEDEEESEVNSFTVDLGMTNLSQNNKDLLANLLGIISLRNNRHIISTTTSSCEAVHVDALVPGGVAYRCGLVTLGDILLCIDAVPVTMNNIEQVLATVIAQARRTVKLDFKSPQHQFDGDIDADDFLNEVKLCSPSSGDSIGSRFNKLPHAFFYLKLASSSASDKQQQDGENDDVMYAYPQLEVGWRRNLFDVRGIFLTVYDVVRENLSEEEDTVLTSNIYIDDEMLHCVYKELKGGGLIIACFPGSCYSSSQAQQCLTDVVTLMQAMYGGTPVTLHAALNDKRLHSRHHHLMAYVFPLNSSLYDSDLSPFRFAGSVHKLELSCSLDLWLNCALTEFESNDYSTAPPLMTSFGPSGVIQRRLFTVISSCMFGGGGLLLASHMGRRETRICHLFCLNHGLLRNCDNGGGEIGLLVIWRELFVSEGEDPTSGVRFSRKPAFKILQRRRRFLLVVGLGTSLLCAQVEMNVVNRQQHVRPPVDIVNAAHSTLIHLRGLPQYRELTTALQRPPVVTKSETHGTTSEEKASRSSFRLPSFSPSLKRSKSFKQLRSSFSSQDSGGGGESVDQPAPALDRYRYLTFGDRQNALMCYVMTRDDDSTFRAPAHRDIATSERSAVTRAILGKFRLSAYAIRDRMTRGCGGEEEENVEEAVRFTMGGNEFPGAGNKWWRSSEFWVVGRRLFSPARMLFVCVSDIPERQNVVELAFRMMATQS